MVNSSAAVADAAATPKPDGAEVEPSRAVAALVAVVAVAFVVRVAWLAYALRVPVGGGDSQFYMSAARSLADGRGYRGPTGRLTALWPPGYPLVLAVGLAFMEPTHWDVTHVGALVNLVLGTATVALVGVLGRRLLGPWSGVGAAAVMAVYPSTVMFTSVMLSETVFGFFGVLAVLVALWRPWMGRGEDAVLPTWQRMAVVGLVSGAAVLVRPPFVFSVVFVPIVIVWMLRPWSAATVRASLVRVGAFALGLLALVVPWTIRNATAMDAFVPISLNTGYNLCMGHNPQAAGGFGTPEYCFHDLPQADSPTAEVQRDSITRARAVDWMTSHPLEEPRLAALKIWAMFGGDRAVLSAVTSYGNDVWLTPRDLAIWTSICDGAYFALLALGLLGLVAWPSRADRRYWVVLGALAGVVLASLAFFGDQRFKQPMVPLLAVAAVVPLRLVLQARRRPDAGTAE